MIYNYFLLPCDIKLETQNIPKKNRLKFNKELTINFVKLLVLGSNNKIIQSTIIDLNNEKLLKRMFSSYHNLENRINKILYRKEKEVQLFRGKKPKIMGILNITKDSFYDGGKFFKPSKAINQAYKLIDEGADIIDVGGESTRPGAKVIPEDEELKRIIPVIRELCRNNITVSCDTRNSFTMERVLSEGVNIINDVSGLNYDKNTLNVIKKYNCYYILMHSIKTPINMQNSPSYKNVILELYEFFLTKVSKIKEKNINTNKIIIDPGIGFGKKDIHNFEILKNFSIFLDLGFPILIGLSRKSFIGRFIKNEKEDRLGCSLSLALDSYLKGASFIRVHDVRSTKNAIDIFKKANC